MFLHSEFLNRKGLHWEIQTKPYLKKKQHLISVIFEYLFKIENLLNCRTLLHMSNLTDKILHIL